MTAIEAEFESGPDEAKVFLSYSRKDRERAQGFADALRARHFGVFKDTDDILPTEEWKGRLEELIAEADTIVFLLSPHSATSEVCEWEVEYASSLNKRIAPIVIEETDPALIPAALAKLNFIFCTPRDPFENAVDTLASALNSDIDWIREHTRLQKLSERWRDAGKPMRLLLRGRDIRDAEAWRDRRLRDAPSLTPIQASFISASRRGAGRRLAWGGGILAIIAAALGGLAFLAWSQGQEIEKRSALLTADAAREVARDGDVAGALTMLLLAAEHFEDDETAPHSLLIGADEVLQRATAETRYAIPDDAIAVLDEPFLLHSQSAGALIHVTSAGAEPVAELPGRLRAINPAGEQFLAVWNDGQATRVTALTPKEEPWGQEDLIAFPYETVGGEYGDVDFTEDGHIVFNGRNERGIRFDAATRLTTAFEPDEGIAPETNNRNLIAPCLDGMEDAPTFAAELAATYENFDYAADFTCVRDNDSALFTVFEAPSAGTIRHIFLVADGWIDGPKTAVMQDVSAPDLRTRPARGFDFMVTDIAAPVEQRVEIRLGMSLDSEAPLVFAYASVVEVVRFLPDGALAVLLREDTGGAGRLAILEVMPEAAYRPRRAAGAEAENDEAELTEDGNADDTFADFFRDLEANNKDAEPPAEEDAAQENETENELAKIFAEFQEKVDDQAELEAQLESETAPPDLKYHDGMEVVEFVALEDPRMAVLKLHIGMAQVEARAYSLETQETWRTLARNHKFVDVRPLLGGGVQTRGQAGTFVFDGLHSAREAINAMRQALPTRCEAADLARSPCLPTRYRH